MCIVSKFITLKISKTAQNIFGTENVTNYYKYFFLQFWWLLLSDVVCSFSSFGTHFIVIFFFFVHSVMFHLASQLASIKIYVHHYKFQQYIVLQFQVRSWIISLYLLFFFHAIQMLYCWPSGSRPFLKYFAAHGLQPVDTIRDKMEIIIKQWFHFHIIICY